MLLILIVAAYALGLAIVIAFCLTAKMSSEFRFTLDDSLFRERSKRVPSVPIQTLPFDTPPHTRHSRKVA